MQYPVIVFLFATAFLALTGSANGQGKNVLEFMKVDMDIINKDRFGEESAITITGGKDALDIILMLKEELGEEDMCNYNIAVDGNVVAEGEEPFCDMAEKNSMMQDFLACLGISPECPVPPQTAEGKGYGPDKDQVQASNPGEVVVLASIGKEGKPDVELRIEAMIKKKM